MFEPPFATNLIEASDSSHTPKLMLAFGEIMNFPDFKSRYPTSPTGPTT